MPRTDFKFNSVRRRLPTVAQPKPPPQVSVAIGVSCAVEVAASAPSAPPTRNGGGGRLMSLAPAPHPLGRGRQCPPLWVMTPPAPPSTGARCPQKYLPALGWGVGGEDAVVPTHACVHAGATRAASPPLPPIKKGRAGGGETNGATTAPYADPV